MNYNDTIKFLATNGSETRRFLFERSKAATSSGYRLYGYNPVENDRNLLEDFGINGRPNHHTEIQKAKERIRFYVDDDWELEVAQRA